MVALDSLGPLQIMVISSGHNTPPHHRPNRRRERPGSRTRRTLSRQSHIQSTLERDNSEAILDAHDPSFYLPLHKTTPSPLLRENFDRSWQRWQSKKAEEKALVEQEQKEQRERIKLFGGDEDGDDDVSLCAPMLRVLMVLFGDLDYADP